VSSLRLVLFGPPGAGKGTQAQLLKERLGVSHISSGDLFRYHLRQRTDLGQRAAEYINQGLLVPDEVTIDIILEQVMALSDEDGFILDGFPRTTSQAEALQEALRDRSRELDKVVFINVPEEELVSRLAGRFTCQQCQAPNIVSDADQASDLKCERCGGPLYQRPDDRPETVRQRIDVYHRETVPVLDFYRKLGLLADIHGVGSVECVNRRVLAALGQDLD
jgi:adenylate kinase